MDHGLFSTLATGQVGTISRPAQLHIPQDCSPLAQVKAIVAHS
jgi:hypothetical protein